MNRRIGGNQWREGMEVVIDLQTCMDKRAEEVQHPGAEMIRGERNQRAQDHICRGILRVQYSFRLNSAFVSTLQQVVGELLLHLGRFC